MGKIKFIKATHPIHSPEWYAARLDSIGASEVGAVLGLSPFTPGAKLWAEKAGIIEPWKSGNTYTFFGSRMENIIEEAWSYYDGEEDSYVKNSMENKIIRQCKKVKGHYINTDHPHLTATPDRMIDKGSFCLMDKSIILANACPLEFKTIGGFELKRWTDGLPIYYLAQVHGQMLCTGTDYAELCLLEDGRKLHVFPIPQSKELTDIIIEKTTDFWNNRVVPAKALVAHMATATEEQKQDIAKALHELEPGPEGTEAYQEFLKERYRVEAKSREITQEEYEFAINYDKARTTKKEAEDDMLLAKNSLLHSMQDYEIVEDDTIKVTNRPATETRKRAYFDITIKK